MHTHADAITKVCPVKSDSAGTVNCVGQACMAWEWAQPRAPNADRLGYCTAINGRPPTPPMRNR